MSLLKASTNDGNIAGMVSEGLMGTQLPCIASHEASGTVVQIGSAIQEFKVGDRILCNLTYHRCGDCADCKGPERDTQYCQHAQYLGVTRDGSFAEYEVVDGRECCLLPDNLSFQSAAPLACAGVTACMLSQGYVPISGNKRNDFPNMAC